MTYLCTYITKLSPETPQRVILFVQWCNFILVLQSIGQSGLIDFWKAGEPEKDNKKSTEAAKR
jgi:hypothetical protein